jgi:hypothetical protein
MKIEAGCMAVIINSVAGNDGVFVTVLRYIGTSHSERGDNLWEVDKMINGTLRPTNLIMDHKLMRIDGFEEQDKVSDGKELINEK